MNYREQNLQDPVNPINFQCLIFYLFPVPNCGVKIKLIECLAKEGIF